MRQPPIDVEAVETRAGAVRIGRQIQQRLAVQEHRIHHSGRGKDQLRIGQPAVLCNIERVTRSRGVECKWYSPEPTCVTQTSMGPSLSERNATRLPSGEMAAASETTSKSVIVRNRASAIGFFQKYSALRSATLYPEPQGPAPSAVRAQPAKAGFRSFVLPSTRYLSRLVSKLVDGHLLRCREASAWGGDPAIFSLERCRKGTTTQHSSGPRSCGEQEP